MIKYQNFEVKFFAWKFTKKIMFIDILSIENFLIVCISLDTIRQTQKLEINFDFFSPIY